MDSLQNRPADQALLIQFSWDCGRSGVVEGLFVSTPQALTQGLGQPVYFGEILGKHSDVYGRLEAGDLRIVTDDADFIAKLVGYLGHSVSGYNPFDYMRSDDNE